MSDEQRKPPWGDAKAIVQRAKRDIWITLGPVWESESGSLSFTIEAEPLAWRDMRVERRVVLVKRDAGRARR